MIDGRRLHPAAWGRVRGVAGRWVNRVGRPHRCTASSSAGFVYPSAPLSRWIYSRSLSAQTQEDMPAATRQQADEEERAAKRLAVRYRLRPPKRNAMQCNVRLYLLYFNSEETNTSVLVRPHKCVWKDSTCDCPKTTEFDLTYSLQLHLPTLPILSNSWRATTFKLSFSSSLSVYVSPL